MPGFKFLRYQLRYQNGADPETLISHDVADALRQAKEKSYIARSTVFLWSEGRLVAECAVPSEKNEKPVSDEVIMQLVNAGFYVMGHIPLDTLETPAGGDMTRPKSREVENENQRQPVHSGEPPRPATEPKGSEDSSRSARTATDAATGQPNENADQSKA